jgi:hypothetical protein
MTSFLSKIKGIIGITLAAIVLSCASFPLVRASDYSSSNFIVRDPIVSVQGGYSSSTNFQAFLSSGQSVIGENASTSFIQRAGFLYFAVVSSPVVTPVAGDAEVDLSWTVSQAYLGATVASYAVGQSTTAGGPYTFTDVGNVLASTRTGLTNDTTYYFIVEARDSDGQNLVRSSEVSAMPTAGVPPPPGGGGGGGSGPVVTSAVLSGQTGPGQVITVLSGSQVVATATANATGAFSVTIQGLTGGQYTYSVFGTDSSQRRTSLYSVPVTVPVGATVTVGNIILSPTVSATASEIKKGDPIIFSGQTVPNASVEITVTPGLPVINITAGADGMFSYSLATSSLEFGTYIARLIALLSPQLFSNPSFPITFKVGNKTVAAPTAHGTCSDFNQDGLINLVDFSILVYWFQKTSPPARIDCNSDNIIDLVDFSILMYYWTG